MNRCFFIDRTCLLSRSEDSTSAGLQKALRVLSAMAPKEPERPWVRGPKELNRPQRVVRRVWRPRRLPLGLRLLAMQK